MAVSALLTPLNSLRFRDCCLPRKKTRRTVDDCVLMTTHFALLSVFAIRRWPYISAIACPYRIPLLFFPCRSLTGVGSIQSNVTVMWLLLPPLRAAHVSRYGICYDGFYDVQNVIDIFSCTMLTKLTFDRPSANVRYCASDSLCCQNQRVFCPSVPLLLARWSDITDRELPLAQYTSTE